MVDLLNVDYDVYNRYLTTIALNLLYWAIYMEIVFLDEAFLFFNKKIFKQLTS